MLHRILSYLPACAVEAVRNASALNGIPPDEIRLYQGGHVVLVLGGKHITTPVRCDSDLLRDTVMKLCGNSLYAHADTIREGYIFTQDGFRVGVSGRAVCHNEHIDCVTDITSLCIRVPRRFPGCADDVYRWATDGDIPRSVLIYSAPGGGKTTVLRELTMLLTDPRSPYRTSVIDTRFELCSGLRGEYLDVFSGYPRAVGMEIAIRTMNPQFVLCDEIATEDDARAVMHCASSGVAVIASAHGSSVDDLQRKRPIKELIDSGIFHACIGLRRVNGRVIHSIQKGELLC